VCNEVLTQHRTLAMLHEQYAHTPLHNSRDILVQRNGPLTQLTGMRLPS